MTWKDVARAAITVVLLFFTVALGNAAAERGYRQGYEAAKREEHERHLIMQQIHLCDWAQIMAQENECKRMSKEKLGDGQ